MLKQESTDTGTESQFIFTKNREDLAHKQTLSLVPVLHLVHYKSTHLVFNFSFTSKANLNYSPSRCVFKRSFRSKYSNNANSGVILQ